MVIAPGTFAFGKVFERHRDGTITIYRGFERYRGRELRQPSRRLRGRMCTVEISTYIQAQGTPLARLADGRLLVWTGGDDMSVGKQLPPMPLWLKLWRRYKRRAHDLVLHMKQRQRSAPTIGMQTA